MQIEVILLVCAALLEGRILIRGIFGRGRKVKRGHLSQGEKAASCLDLVRDGDCTRRKLHNSWISYL